MRQKQLSEERYKVKIGTNFSIQTQFIGLLQGHQKIYCQKVQNNMSVTKPKIDIEFEENSPHQEGIILEFYQRPDKLYLQQSRDLENLVNTGNLVQIFLPKQADIDKILNIIQQKVLKGTHLSVTVKEIEAGYLCSSYFKDIY